MEFTPDFILPNGVVVEVKGRLCIEDRQMHLLLKRLHPDLEVRFIFPRSFALIRKGVKLTYGDWCQKYGFRFADQVIPASWLEEAECQRRRSAIEAAWPGRSK